MATIVLTDLDESYDAIVEGDVIYGLAGEDIIAALANSIIVYGGDGLDNLLAAADFVTIHGGLDSDYLLATGTGTSLFGDEGADLLVSRGSANALYGGAGDDTMVGNSSSDYLAGGQGDDTYQASNGATIFEAADEGRDLVLTTSLTFSLSSYQNIENVMLARGVSGNVNFAGNALDNDIYGSSGDDTLDGGGGDDLLFGGVGNDILIGGSGNDIFEDVQAGDTLVEEADGGQDLVVSTDTTVDLQDWAAIEDLHSFAEGNATLSGNANGNQIWSASYVDSGLAGTATIYGLGGNDTIYGLQFVNVIDAGSGDDLVLCAEPESLLQMTFDEDGVPLFTTPPEGAGSDTVSGGDGDDMIFGGYGVDLLSGEAGSDLLVGGLGADVATGGTGADTFVVDDEGDSVTEASGEGYDVALVFAGASSGLHFANVERILHLGNTSLISNGGHTEDVLNGGTDADVLYGAGGNDTLSGGNGIDRLSGGEGADALGGGSGADILQGGNGSDRFDFNTARDSGKLAGTRDIILDFQHLGDDIDLRTIDSNTRTTGNNGFTFKAMAAFSHHAGELRYYKVNLAGSASDRTIIEGDVNGDAKADFQIELLGLKSLSAADFVL